MLTVCQNGAEISDQKEVWEEARKNFEVGNQIMEFNFKTQKPFSQFTALSERDRKFLVKFSCPWDVKFAIDEGMSHI